MRMRNLVGRIANRLNRVVKLAKPATAVAIVAGSMMFAGPAEAQLFSENFDDLPLGPFVVETGGDGTDWTDIPPVGWVHDTTDTPTEGPPEFFGFTFLDKDAWIAAAGNQSRDEFTRGSGTVMVADPDEYDDVGDIGDDLFNAFMTTPPINLAGVEAGSVTINFDSTFRPYDTQTGLVDVSYDGGSSWTNLLTLNNDTAGGQSSLSRANEAVSLLADNPSGGDMLVRFGMTDAGNDWWWAIDNVVVESDPKFTIQVNRDTGEISFGRGGGSALDTQGYSITSEAGTLNSDNWSSIAETADANSGGSFDPNATWVRFTGDGVLTDLSEGVLGTTTISAGTFHSFGADVWTKYWDEDLEFRYLDGAGEEQLGAIEYIGNGGEAFSFGDLTFDGVIDELDWLEFVEGLGGEFTDLSIAAAYQLGDLNADLEVDHADFLIFKSNFDAVNGAGSFDVMLQSIPEPGSLLLLLLGLAFIVGPQRRKAVLNACLLAAMLGVLSSNSAEAQVLLLEDFEGLALLDSDLASDDFDETDWTNEGPSEWISDPRNTPDNPDRPEFQGWTYMDHTFWLNQQGNQAGRADFLPGLQPNNTIAVVDPDAHDDFINNDPDQFSAVLQSAPIDLTGVAAGSVRVSFDSTWVPEDLQEGQFNVVIDGVRTTLFTWDSEPNANFKPAATNERVDLAISNPAGASTMTLEWDVVEAGNDWWWGIDNVLVESTGQTQFLGIAVNTLTGETTIENSTGGPLEINYYEIQSPGGSLDSGDWNSLDEQDFDAIGPGIGQSWDEGAQSDSSELVEAYLLSTSVFDPDQTVSIGRAYEPSVNAEDLTFFYAGPDGDLIEGSVRYISDGITGDFNGDGDYGCEDIDGLIAAIIAGGSDTSFDLTGDGTVDLADRDAWLAEAGAAELASGNPYLLGDANLDGVVDVSDFGIWNGNKFTTTGAWCSADFNADGVTDVSDFGIWNGNKFTSADSAAAVPEPSAWMILVGLLGMVCLGSRRKLNSAAAILLGVALLGVVGPQNVMAEVDRNYLLGEDSFENGFVGSPVGFFFQGDTFTADSQGSPGFGDLQDLAVRGNPIYADVSDRPAYSSGIGVTLDGDGDYLVAPNLNLPATSASSQGYDDLDGGVPGPLNYDGITDRGFQFWVKPSSAGQASLQTIVTDADQHGVRIVNGNWSMRYGNTDYDSDIAVDFDSWSHVQVVRPDGPESGSALYVNGVAVSAAPGGYTGTVNLELVVGSNTARDGDGFFNGGTEEFFNGTIDNLTMSVYGDNSAAGGQDWGSYSFGADNEFAALQLNGLNLADINGDGIVSGDGTGPAASDDVSAFVDGWLQPNLVNGLQVADLNSRTLGDLDFNGITDLKDYAILNAANSSLAGLVGDRLAVPEPSAGVLGLLGLALLCLQKRKTH